MILQLSLFEKNFSTQSRVMTYYNNYFSYYNLNFLFWCSVILNAENYGSKLHVRLSMIIRVSAENLKQSAVPFTIKLIIHEFINS